MMAAMCVLNAFEVLASHAHTKKKQALHLNKMQYLQKTAGGSNANLCTVTTAVQRQNKVPSLLSFLSPNIP